MSITHTGADAPVSGRPHSEDAVDFTLMYAAHDAFRLGHVPESHRQEPGTQRRREVLPWMPEATSATAGKQILSQLPPPARLLCRAEWVHSYARTPHWNAASTRTAAERQTS
jgi:hypothetical protein